MDGCDKLIRRACDNRKDFLGGVARNGYSADFAERAAKGAQLSLNHTSFVDECVSRLGGIIAKSLRSGLCRMKFAHRLSKTGLNFVS